MADSPREQEYELNATPPSGNETTSPRMPGVLRPTRSGIPSRKKACTECVTAKTRCDLHRPSCARCTTRGLSCHYRNSTSSAIIAQSSSPAIERNTNSTSNVFSRAAVASGSGRTSYAASPRLAECNLLTPETLHQSSPSTPGNIPAAQPVNFSDLSLVASVDFIRIRDRWLDLFIAPPFFQTPKEFSPRTLSYISRVLKSYPRMLLRSDRSLPPFIHPMQLEVDTPVPLANCLSLTRMWWNRAPGSERIVTETIGREMSRLLNESYSQTDLLAAFQSYLIYSLMAFFAPVSSEEGINHGDLSSLFDGTTMVALQELASKISETGVVCSEELLNTRPRWESWIIAEAKRRTLYIMYFLENMFQHMNNTPSYIAEELAMLPAPCGRILWEAQRREDWSKGYDAYLTNWAGQGGLRMHDFWPKSDQELEEQRRQRVDKWTEDVDAFGMMLLAVCTLTHDS